MMQKRVKVIAILIILFVTLGVCVGLLIKAKYNIDKSDENVVFTTISDKESDSTNTTKEFSDLEKFIIFAGKRLQKRVLVLYESTIKGLDISVIIPAHLTDKELHQILFLVPSCLFFSVEENILNGDMVIKIKRRISHPNIGGGSYEEEEEPLPWFYKGFNWKYEARKNGTDIIIIEKQSKEQNNESQQQ